MARLLRYIHPHVSRYAQGETLDQENILDLDATGKHHVENREVGNKIAPHLGINIIGFFERDQLNTFRIKNSRIVIGQSRRLNQKLGAPKDLQILIVSGVPFPETPNSDISTIRVSILR